MLRRLLILLALLLFPALAYARGIEPELVAEGLSVIMVSSELPEILGMSDRVVVMREGRIAGIFDNAGLSAETLVRTAAGIAEEVLA